MSQQPEKSVAQILRDAAALIELNGWCQGTFAVDSEGFKTTADDPLAVSWCALGAIDKTTDGRDALFDAADVALRPHCSGNVALWNDAPERTQAEVVAKLLEAAELAEREATHV